MSFLWKIGIIGFLVLLIFGGGGFTAYVFFFKKPGSKPSAGNQAVVTPTPDPGISLLSQAQQLLTKGDAEQGKQLLVSLFQNFPASAKAAEAKKTLGDLNIRQFFSDANPSKTNYVVARGDSIARISGKTKAAPELIFKANGLESLMLHPGQILIIPSGQFALQISLANKDLTLLNHGTFFKWYKPVDYHLPPKVTAGQYKVIGKDTWSAGTPVAFGGKDYLGSSRWIVLNTANITIYSETNPANPNAQKPKFGIEISADEMEELYSLVGRDCPVSIR
ncbi:MAG TPA: LysM peptidoglycan-binding domain-containing protein [Chthoniobacterales bacterium]|nr:LysM peptidoglycan-binding domain-containing protein [Chthoniobacterales bacterium]